jgi:NADPH:quinone reductase-like Zn-dependent oxidoreductase
MLANNVPILKPSGFEVSVKVLSAGLNPVDWKRCEYEIPNIYHFPGYVGLDGFGIVLAVGE